MKNKFDRGAVYQKRKGHGYQYACVESSQCAEIGVTKALEPIPPAGRGWRLTSSAVVGTGPAGFVVHWWERRT